MSDDAPDHAPGDAIATTTSAEAFTQIVFNPEGLASAFLLIPRQKRGAALVAHSLGQARRWPHRLHSKPHQQH